ncbi:MAG: extracellular solute-binding protein [Azospirillaceae bacterium]
MSRLKTVFATGVAAAALMAGAAQAQEVRWNDDTVDLVLGDLYDNQVITVPRDMLGTVFGPDEQPFEGAEISVTVNAAGPKGGIAGPLYAFKPIWEQLSGGTVNVVELPFSEHYTKMMLDVRQGTGEYDAFMVGAFWYGDLAGANYAYPLDDFMAGDEFPQWSYDPMPENLRVLHQWDETPYGVLNDADGQVLYYRKDMLTDPEHQAAFEEEYGYAMPEPPETWQQVLDMANYFNGKNWDDNDAEPDSGIALHLKVGEQGHYHFQSLSAPFVLNPGDSVTQYDNVYWFDPTDMTPLIDSPGHVAALEFLQELYTTGPDAAIGWSLGEAWDYFLRGKAVFAFSWGDLGSLAQDPERSNVQGQIGASLLPSTDQYWDFEAEAWVDAPEDRRVGNTTGGSWHGVISAFSPHPEATYSFLSLMAMKPVSLWNAQHGWTGVDPGYDYQFLEPEGEATVEEYVGAGWNENDVTEYLGAYQETFNAPTMLPYLRIPGTFEYWDTLDKNLSAAMAGDMTAQEALETTAEAWQATTDRLGRDEQLQLYREAIGYEG